MSIGNNVRPASLNDIDGISSVAELTWHNTYGPIYSSEFIRQFLEEAYSPSRLEADILRDEASPIRKFMVAEADEQIVGYAQLTDTDHGECELSRIYVLPEFQGKGVGRSLLNEMIRRDQSIESVFAWVEKDNPIGVRFYQSNHFTFAEEMEETLNGHTTILHKYIRPVRRG